MYALTTMMTNATTPLAFFNFSGWELAIILVLGLLIFGRRLPELGRSVGKTIVEFKKGLADVHTDVSQSASQQSGQQNANQNQSLPPGQVPQSGVSQQSQQSVSEKR